MSKQVKLDKYFQQLPSKSNMGSNQESKIRECDEYLNITLEQFSECTNIKELVTADMRDKMPHKFQRKFLLVDKYVKRVYDRYISDSKYRKKPLFKNLVFHPKPWYTKRDRELLKQHGISKCFVNMYENNVLKDIADSCLQNAIKAHGGEMSEVIKKSLPFYVKKILDLYLNKHKTSDGLMKKYRKYSSKIGKAHNKFSTPTGVVAGPYSQDVTKKPTILTSSNQNNCAEESPQSSYGLNVSTSAQNDISEPIFLISADRCSTQKEVNIETPISYNYGHAQEEIRPEVGRSERYYERSNVSLNNTNSFENNVEEHFQSDKLNWLEQEYGLNTRKCVLKPLKKELSKAIEIRIKQQYPNVIENIEEVVNKALTLVWSRIIRNMEERRDVLGFIEMQSGPQGDGALKSEIRSRLDNAEDVGEAPEILEELRENRNLPLPKMLTYNEFKEYTNVKEYLYNDIIKKYPYKTEDYLSKIDKYVKKFYKSYILGSDIWPNGIFLKSKEFLTDFHEYHILQKVKCEPDADIHSNNINASEVIPASPIICGKSICTNNATTCLNRKRKHFPQTVDMKSDVNIDTNKKEDGNGITSKQVNSPNMHDTQIEINSPFINNDTEMQVDFESTTKNDFTNQINASYGNDIERGLNNPMVLVPLYTDQIQTTNCDNGTAEKRVCENTPRNPPGSLLSVDCNDLQNQFEQPTLESSFNINKEIKKEPNVEFSRGNQVKENLYLAEEENDVAFVSCQQPEFIYISDEPLSTSLLLEEMMHSPPKPAIPPYQLPTGFSAYCTENKTEVNRMETISIMNSSDNQNYTERQAAKRLPQNILVSSKTALDLLENNSHEFENNGKDKSYKINSNENNRTSYEKKQPKMDLCLESGKEIYDQSSENNENNTKMCHSNLRPNEEELAIPDLKISKFKENRKTTEASDVMRAKIQQKGKKASSVKSKFEVRIDMQRDQNNPTVKENKDKSTNYNPIRVPKRIVRSVEKPNTSETKSSVDNRYRHLVETRKILANSLSEKDKNVPLPKMLSFHEFCEYSNIKEYLHNAINKKYPYQSMSYFTKMDKYIRKFYKNYIKGSDIWPSGVFFKSMEHLDEFLQKYKHAEVKCLQDVYTDNEVTKENGINHATNAVICLDSIGAKNAASYLNENRQFISKQSSTESATDTDTDLIQSKTEKSPISKFNTIGTNETENRSNASIVNILRYTDTYTTNFNICSMGGETATTSSFTSLINPAGEENRLEEPAPICSCTADKEDIKQEFITNDEEETISRNPITGNSSYFPKAILIKQELEEAVDQQCCDEVIENTDEVVNNVLENAYQRITDNVEEERIILEPRETPCVQSVGMELKTEMELINDHTQDHSVEVHEVDQGPNDNKIMPPSKMLSYNEFKEYSNINNYLQNDIIKKFPCKSSNYLIKMDKYIRKFYKHYILRGDNWPKGVLYKSNEVLREFPQNHKCTEIKCETDVDTDNIGTNVEKNTQYMSESSSSYMESIDESRVINNRKRVYISNPTETNLNTNIREDDRAPFSISGHEPTIVNNLESEINEEKMYNKAYTVINGTDICNDNRREKDYQRMPENPTGQLGIQGISNAENELNIPMVVIPQYADLSMITTREVVESGARIHINNFLGSGNRVDQISEEAFKSGKHTSQENQIKEDTEGNIAFTYKERENIISEIPLEFSYMMLPPRMDVIDHEEISSAFSAISEYSKNTLNFSKQNLGKLNEPGEGEKENSTNGTNSKNIEKISAEVQTQINICLTEEKEETSSQKIGRDDYLKKLKKSNHFGNGIVSPKIRNLDASRVMSKVRVKIKRISTQNVKPDNEGKKAKRLKQHAIKTRLIPLNNIVSQNSLTSHPLLSMSKVKVKVQRITKQKFVIKYPNIKWPSNSMD